MKKRAQPPDSHTYTIILRGLAMHKDHPHSLIRALSVYNSMFAPNSPVKPSIIHSNAVLKVCARRLDMDALYGVAARLPTHGAGAPDNQTFTTILNAVRHSAWTFGGSVISETPEDTAKRRHRAAMEGRRMWDDVIRRWRKGDIWIDEELVCAMGRLLLISRHPQDLDDVLSLVEQTMAIPRAIPLLNAPERSSVAPVPARLYQKSAERLPDDDEPGMNKTAIKEEQEEDDDGYEEEQREEGLDEVGEEEPLKEEAVEKGFEYIEDKEDNVHLHQTDQPDQSPQLDEASGSFGASTIDPMLNSSPVISDSEFTPADLSHATVFNPKTRRTQPVSYVRPGNNTLSLLMDACVEMHAGRAAQDYWGRLTAAVADGGYGIYPDAENYFMYLRLLRLQRSSRLAIELLEEKLGSADANVDKSGTLVFGPMTSKYGHDLAVPKTFRIAMSACVRDKTNPQVLGHAIRLLRLMQARLPEPDPVVLGMYLEVASMAGRRSQVRTGEKMGWQRLLKAVEVAEVSFRNLKSLLNFGYGEVGLEQEEERERRLKNGSEKMGMAALEDARRRVDVYDQQLALADDTGALPRPTKPLRERVPNSTRRGILDLARGMVSAYDRVLDEGQEELSPMIRHRCLDMRHTWAAYISRSMGCGREREAWRGGWVTSAKRREPRRGERSQKGQERRDDGEGREDEVADMMKETENGQGEVQADTDGKVREDRHI